MLTVKLSNDTTNVKITAVRMPCLMTGRVIRKKVRTGPAPSIWAASSSEGPMECRLAETTRMA